MTVSVADIDRWDPGDVREVFHATRSQAEASFEAADGIATLPGFADWGGDTADAAKAAQENLRRDLDAQGNEVLVVADAARHAADAMDAVKRDLSQIRSEAEQAGLSVEAATSQVVYSQSIDDIADMIAVEPVRQALSDRMLALLVRAAAVDDGLAATINMAIGATPVPPAAAVIELQDGDAGDAPAQPTGASALADLIRANNQAVIDAMGRVQRAQAAVDRAAHDAYTGGAGSSQGSAAMSRLPQLKQELANALDELGQIPDYSGIDPTSVSLSPSGRLLFASGGAQVVGTLRNGTGQLFDQRSLAYHTYENGKLVRTRILDEGRAIATAEPLLTAVTTATGIGPLVKSGEGAYLGLRALFGREGAETLGVVTGETVLPRAVELAGARASAAVEQLTAHGPGAWAPVTESMSARAAAYQTQITGHPFTEGYQVGGYTFDGFADGVLLEAKSYYKQFVDSDGTFKEFFRGGDALLNQARNQLDVAGTTPVRWVFAETETMAAVRQLLADRGIRNIEFVIVPPK